MIKSDYKRYRLSVIKLFKGWFTGHAFFAVLFYRIGHWFARRRIGFIPDYICFRAFRRYGCSISSYARIDEGFMLHHTDGIVIGFQVIIGKNCEVFQNVTIGSNRKEKDGRFMPIIGNNVIIGSGAVVVGPIKIGNNVKIGANSYIDKDVPDNVTIVGIPGKIVNKL